MSTSSGPLGADGVVRCKHHEPAQRLVSRTDKNPNRPFYICNRPHSETCNFFYWGDDPLFARASLLATTVQASLPSIDYPHIFSTGLRTPDPSPLQSTSTSALQPAHAKRRRPEGSVIAAPPTSNPVSADSPTKKTRLEAIEAGLRARAEGETPLQPPCFRPAVPKQSDVLPFTYSVEQNEATSPASDTPTDIEEEEAPPRARYSFLGLTPTQESEPATGPSTPKKCPSAGRQELSGHRAESPSSTLLTPPQSAKPRGNHVEAYAPTASGSGSSRPQPVTPAQHKGKERANLQWDQPIEDEENPFVDRPSLLMSDTNAARQFSLGSQGPSCTPTTAERITANITGIRDVAATLRKYADAFEQLDAVRYIERLEREKSALAVKDEAKAKRIAALTAENMELKEKLCQYEEDRRVKNRSMPTRY